MKTCMLVIVFSLIYAVAAFAGQGVTEIAPEIQPLPESFYVNEIAAQSHHMQTEVRRAFIKHGLRELRKAGSRADAVTLFDQKRMVAEISLDPTEQYLSASIDLELETVSTVEWERFYLDDFTEMEVLLDGEPIDFIKETFYGENLIKVSFDPPLAEGETHVLTFNYAGPVDCSGSIIYDIPECIFDEQNTVFISNNWYPIATTDHAAQLWQSDISLNFPTGLLAATTGRLVETIDNEDGSTTRRYVMSELYDGGSLVAADYSEFYTQTDFGTDVGVRLENNLETGPAWAERYAEILEDFSNDYHLYPSAIFNANEIPNAVGAGLGYYAGVLIPKGSFRGGPVSSEGYNSIHAHETGHNWFPGLVPVDDYYAPWLSEGFAEYSAIQFSTGDFDWYPMAYMRSYGLYLAIASRFDPAYDRALSDDRHIYDDEMAYTLVTYNKGSLALLQLHHLYGEEQFHQAMRDYVDNYLYQPTNTSRLQESLAASLDHLREDMSIEEYFEQWILGTGYPLYTVGLRSEQVNGAWVSSVSIKQQGEKVFSIPQEVRLYTSDQEETLIKTVVGGEDRTVVFNSQSPPTRALLDPDYKSMRLVLSELPGDANSSGEVDGVDLLYYGYAAGSSLWESSNYVQSVDFNLDAEVNGSDLDEISAHFGERLE